MLQRIFIIALTLIIAIVINISIQHSNNHISKLDYVSYNEICTGDIVLVDNFTFSSKGVKYFSNSHFSHIGIICELDNEPIIAHSHLSNKGEYMSQTNKGVQKNNLNDFIAKYPKANILIMKNKSLTITQRKEIVDEVNCLMFCPYESSFLKIINSVLKSKYLYNGETTKSFFCNQFVAHILQKVGVLSKELKPSLLNLRQLYYCLLKSKCYEKEKILKLYK